MFLFCFEVVFKLLTHSVLVVINISSAPKSDQQEKWEFPNLHTIIIIASRNASFELQMAFQSVMRMLRPLLFQSSSLLWSLSSCYLCYSTFIVDAGRLVKSAMATPVPRFVGGRGLCGFNYGVSQPSHVFNDPPTGLVKNTSKVYYRSSPPSGFTTTRVLA